MFHRAALKLTVWYLSIILALSIGCSLALYHVYSNDLARNIRHQITFFNGFLGPSDSSGYNDLRMKQLDEDRQHLRRNLALFNLSTLVVGGIASYALARRTLEPIEESLEAQSRFAADASHELRTPLTAMQTEIEVSLRDDGLTKVQAVNLLKSNLEEVAKLRALSDGLLKLANQDTLDSEKNSISKLKPAMEEAINRLLKPVSAKKITIKNSTTNLHIKIDHQSLVELLVVLLDNAIKYSPSGSNITTSSSKQSKNAKIVVSDSGQGIKALDLPHIFDRFYRAESSRSKSNVEGYGLGLAIARKIVEANQGSIEVASAVGKGTKFTIVLPLAS